MRGIAAIAVVMVHYKPFFSPVLASNGGLAVDLFFIMSGVVLAHAYEDRFKSGMTVAAFMTIRVIRLYPLYLLGLAIAVVVAMGSMAGRSALGWQPGTLATALVLALVMLPGPSPTRDGRMFALNIPTWSLFFEILVNFAFVALAPFLRTGRLIATCAVCIPVLGYVALTQGDLDKGMYLDDAWIGAVRTVFGFSVGVIIARRRTSGRFARSLPWFLGLLALVVLALFMPTSGLGRAGWSFACVVVLFPAVVYAATRIEPPE